MIEFFKKPPRSIKLTAYGMWHKWWGKLKWAGLTYWSKVNYIQKPDHMWRVHRFLSCFPTKVFITSRLHNSNKNKKYKNQLQEKEDEDKALQTLDIDNVEFTVCMNYLVGQVACADIIMPTMTPKSPSALPNISITRILTKRDEFCASDKAQLLPIIPTQSLCRETRDKKKTEYQWSKNMALNLR